jgi:hypothetical protein
MMPDSTELKSFCQVPYDAVLANLHMVGYIFSSVVRMQLALHSIIVVGMERQRKSVSRTVPMITELYNPVSVMCDRSRM